ncbi:MAG: hypothetical protein NTV94_16355 [Planctomycetota bacterium]|nr:hypothetical protein [Planctomycetota bacterium]
MSLSSMPLALLTLAHAGSGDQPTHWTSYVFRDDVVIPVVIFGSIILIVAIRTVAGVVTSVSRERSRREIAAFIAEGSMTPEQGERLMRAGNDKCT